MLHRITWNRSVFTFKCVFTLNWIVWIKTVWLNWIALNRNVFDKLCTHAKRNCLKLNWQICIKMGLALNNLQRLIYDRTQPTLEYMLSMFAVPGIGLAVRVFANRPGDLGSFPGRVIPKTQKMVLDASLLNTQHYKVWIKGKVEQSRERISAVPYTLV